MDATIFYLHLSESLVDVTENKVCF